MASEITYAEVKFKNASPTAAVEVPTQTKKHEHHPQKYPPWLPWLISLLLLLVCIALVILLGRGWLCCPNGWKRFKKSCYYMSVDMMNWAESEQNCTAMGSHLVVINTTAEQTFLTEELQQSPRGRNYYIGLTAQALGQWQWVDQTPYNESAMFWRSGEPSNVAVEACVVIHTNPKIHNWNDIQCGNHYRICEAAALIV
ncbi:C-type lectin domain family 4 member A isoform X2 [Cuculus canorus]|uniref:C-type lectin domain family 4 member A isoform X2 n=1 Tax=Cuculus canorus TaxID=55661 RepID=UPI0023AA8AAB|nr:C-type lectin domain family 4 member A isoform X2 [Cuculus canorus]